jgi:methionyl-tRNA formyltransferase
MTFCSGKSFRKVIFVKPNVMKIALLTTQTPHHAFFVREIATRFDRVHVFCESQGLRAPFDISHPFEAERDQFERHSWFQGADPRLDEFVQVTTVDTMNGAEGISALASWKPDVAIVFGTGRLSSAVLESGPRCFLNLHGGDPEEYRGLDTHLWAIYHSDFGGLITTLHRVNSSLDDGDICLQESVAIFAGMQLHELRRANTEACVRLAAAALSSVREQGDLPCRKQRRSGRYYSFMPSELKELCRKRFQKHTQSLVSPVAAEGTPQ